MRHVLHLIHLVYIAWYDYSQVFTTARFKKFFGHKASNPVDF
jgi:hypothetical protein